MLLDEDDDDDGDAIEDESSVELLEEDAAFIIGVLVDGAVNVVSAVVSEEYLLSS